MACLLPLQLAHYQGYVGHLSPSTDCFITDFIMQLNTKHIPFHTALGNFEAFYHVSVPYVTTGNTHWLKTLILKTGLC